MMQNIIDFLSFKLLISPYILIICYYLGALAIPLASWYIVFRFKKNYKEISKISQQLSKNIMSFIFGAESNLLLHFLFIALFISTEIMWRMMFEFMLAYFQIRDALI